MTLGWKTLTTCQDEELECNLLSSVTEDPGYFYALQEIDQPALVQQFSR